MSKRMVVQGVPILAFAMSALLAVLAGPSLGSSGRSMMYATGKKYRCPTCDDPKGKLVEAESPPKPDCKEENPVHFASGANLLTHKDLHSDGLSGWGITRAYLQEPSFAEGSLGPCWRIGELYRLVQNGPQIQVVSGNVPVCAFDDNGSGTYTPQFDYVQTLTADVANHLLIFKDSVGKRWIFFDFSATWTPARQGRFKEFNDQGGNVTTATYGSSGVTLDKLLEMQQTDTNPAVLNRFSFAYNLSGASVGLLASITYSQTVSGVTTTVRVANYSYYTSGGPNGPAGALQRVRVADGLGNTLERCYYRYNATAANGWVPLRYAVNPEGYERLMALLGSDAAIDAAPDLTVSTYADYFFQYDALARVVQEVVQGKGCGCGPSGSRGTYSYFFQAAGHGQPDAPNVWRDKCTVTLPDGNQRIVYVNGAGQTMLDVFKEVATGLQWRKYYVYNSDHSLASVAYPSAVTSHDEMTAALVSSAMLPDAAGMWFLADYHAATNIPAGAVAKYPSALKVRQGEFGVPVLQSTFLYSSRTGATSTIYPLASKTVYRNTDGTGSQVTSFSHTWQGTSTQPLQKTTSYPAVPTAQNGSGVVVSEVVQFDAFGRETWRKDGDQFIHATEYDTLSGSVTKRIVDVNTASVANEPSGWVTVAGGGLHLTTTAVVDSLGRTTKVTDPAGNVTYTVYKDPQHEVRVYPGWVAATNTTTGPTILGREDWAGSYRERLTMSAVPSVSGVAPNAVPNGGEAVGGLQSLSRDYLDTGSRAVHTDSYFTFSGLTYSTAANIGSLGTHYYRAYRGYDSKGHQNRSQDWAGTITRTTYDLHNRATSTWIGTDDVPTSGDWSPGNTSGTNLIRVSTNQYDGGAVGDGNLTRTQTFTSAIVSLDTTTQFDFRGRFIKRTAPGLLVSIPTYDNLDHVLTLNTYYDFNNDGVVVAADLRARSEAKFDDQGRVYQKIRHQVSNSGVIGNHLTENLWYNGRSMLLKSRDPNGLLRKSLIDGAGRTKAKFLSYDDAETAYTAAFDVVSDTVIDERVVTYDAAGNAIQETRYQRSSLPSVPAGDLATGWAVANSRRTFLASWYDAANRTTSVVDYGTNNNASFTRPATAPAPNSSSNIHVTKTEYDAGGRPFKTTNNLARITQKTFDALGREIRVVENFVDGVAVETELDADRITDVIFDGSGRLSQRIAYNPKGSGLGVQSQTTKYVYGTIANQAAPLVYRNDLLAAEIYPDSDDTYNPGAPAGSQLAGGADSVYDRVEYTYDYASRRLTMQDQRQTVHTYDYNGPLSTGAGKLTRDTVTTLGAGVDGSVRVIYYGYDSLGRIQQSNSYADTSLATLVNFETVVYDGWGRRNIQQEMHTATSPAVTTFENHADGTVSAQEAKFVRLSSVTYGNGRGVHHLYPSGGVGDKLSRVDSIANDAAGAVKFAQYTYLGVDVPVRVDHAVTAGLRLDYGIDTGSPAGIDRLGRVIDHKWGSTADAQQFERFQYTYNRMNNRLTSDRTLTGAPADRDEQYTYDNLHRLKTMKRGTLSGTSIANTASTYNEEWNALEAQGNWRTHRWDPDGGVGSAGTITWTSQSRKHNKVNEIDVDDSDENAAGASITGTGANWIDPQYDKSGNLKNGPKAGDETTAASRQHYTFDAWNRLVKVQSDNGAGGPGTTLAEYQYDGRNRRIVKLQPNGANWNRRDYYYNSRWQVVEERELLNTASKTTVATSPKYQWVWDIRYIDAPILRDENKNGDSSCDGAGDERLYYVQDSNFNVTALVTTAGVVVERYAYNWYGKASVLAPAWGAQSPSLYRNEILFSGYRHDPETGNYHVRNRSYHPTLGRWLGRDPMHYHDSMNLAEYVRSNPVTGLDPSGLKTWRMRVAGPNPPKELIENFNWKYDPWGPGDWTGSGQIIEWWTLEGDKVTLFTSISIGGTDWGWFWSNGNSAKDSGRADWKCDQSTGVIRKVIDDFGGIKRDNTWFSADASLHDVTYSKTVPEAGGDNHVEGKLSVNLKIKITESHSVSWSVAAGGAAQGGIGGGPGVAYGDQNVDGSWSFSWECYCTDD